MHVYASVGRLHGEDKSAAQQIAEDCSSNLKSLDLKTKTGREQAVKSTAKCAAEAACAIYSKGAIPPGVCGTIAGPIINTAVNVWNSVFGDNEEAERAKIRDANTAKFFQTLDRLLVMDAAWVAYSRNTMTRLIQFHDQNLPSRRGAWGGGILTKDKIAHADITKPGIPTEYQSWDVERYSNFCPVFEKLVKLGGLPTRKPQADLPEKCGGLLISNLFYEFQLWGEKNPNAGAVAATSAANDLINKTFPHWVESLDLAANKLRNEVVIEAVRQKIDDKPSSTPVQTAVKVGAAAGIGWLLWKYVVPLVK